MFVEDKEKGYSGVSSKGTPTVELADRTQSKEIIYENVSV